MNSQDPPEVNLYYQGKSGIKHRLCGLSLKQNSYSCERTQAFISDVCEEVEHQSVHLCCHRELLLQ